MLYSLGKLQLFKPFLSDSALFSVIETNWNHSMRSHNPAGITFMTETTLKTCALVIYQQCEH